MGNAIMAAFGKKPKRGMDEEPEIEMVDEEESDIDLDEDEMAAGKAAFDAKTPEEYTKALKALIKLCGGY